jgi:transcriptional regulator with PAS, ATPase and Fis domain
VLDFRIDDYQKEIIEEFSTTDFKIAVFDSKNTPIIWPFAEEYLVNFSLTEDKFYLKNEQYLVVDNKVGSTNWRVFLFKKDTKFEQYRAITIILLVFALYYCIYQLLVELWGVNSAKSYFDNIDFAILNQINEGIIISNNAGMIVFANKAAHEIFSERKNTLINVKLKEIMGHIEDFPNKETDTQTLLLKTSDKIWEAIHSPIIKNGKKLGALSVIRVNASEQQSYKHVFSKLLQTIPEGIIYVDENNIIVTANLMAKCYLGSLDRGKSIESLDSELANAIRKNINTQSFSRVEIKAHNFWCDIAPVYDHDGVYIGSLIVLLNNNFTEWE